MNLSARRYHAALALLHLLEAIEAISQERHHDASVHWTNGFHAHCELAFTRFHYELRLTETLGVAY